MNRQDCVCRELFVLGVQVETVLGVFFGARDFDGDAGAAIFSLEEGVDGFHEEGFCAGHGLGEFCVEK